MTLTPPNFSRACQMRPPPDQGIDRFSNQSRTTFEAWTHCLKLLVAEHSVSPLDKNVPYKAVFANNPCIPRLLYKSSVRTERYIVHTISSGLFRSLDTRYRLWPEQMLAVLSKRWHDYVQLSAQKLWGSTLILMKGLKMKIWKHFVFLALGLISVSAYAGWRVIPAKAAIQAFLRKSS